MNDKKVKLSRCALLIIALSVGEYAIEHLLYLFVDGAVSGGIGITADALSGIGLIFGYISQLTEVFTLSLASTLALLSYATSGPGRTAACAGVAVAARLAYLVPHYYMTFMSYGYDSFEALLALLPMCLFILALYYVGISLGVILGALPARLRAKRNGGNSKEMIISDTYERATLDLGNSSTAAIAIISLLATFIPLCAVITDTVTLLVNRGGSVTPLMLLEILFDFLFILVTFTVTHAIISSIKSKLLSVNPEQTNNNTKSADADTEETV